MSQSQQPQIFETFINGGMVLIGDYNTTLTMPTSTNANSFLGFTPAGESIQPEIDNRPVGLSKGIFGEDNGIEYVSSGQKTIFTLSLNSMSKSSIAKILSENVNIPTPLVLNTPDIGTVEGQSEAGRALTPYRFVWIPFYTNKAGVFINSEVDNEYMIEIPKGQILTPWNPEFATGDYVKIDLEIHAMPNPITPATNKPWRMGGDINLVIA